MLQRTLIRNFNTSPINFKHVKLKNTKTKGVSSQNWLQRQLADPYVEKAKIMNYRCRSAFKLLEIDEKYKLLTQGQVVIDCGASPGSWTQVAVKKVNSDQSNPNQPVGKVISIDVQHLFPIEGAVILGNMDITQTRTQLKVKEVLDNRKINVVLSDMAPRSTGIAELDQENIVKLCYITLRLALELSEINSVLLMKLWQNNQLKQLENDIKRFYQQFDIVKPNSSRTNSAEIFLLCRQFKGIVKKVS